MLCVQAWWFKTLLNSTKGLSWFTLSPCALSCRMLKHPLARRLECGYVSLFQGQPLFLGPGQVLSFLLFFCSLHGLPWAFLSCTGAQLEPRLWWGGIGDWETQLLLSFIKCMYLVLKGTSVSPYQQTADLLLPTATGDGRSRGDLSPSLLFLRRAAAGCSCPRDGQSHLCRLAWRWHRPLAVSLLCTLTGWRVLGCATAPAAGDWKEKWGQDCSVHTACQYTANQVPPRGKG